ncbi:MAG: molybdenum cofactor biosynthesis protein [Bacillales bacterium]|jgi:molybdenum cofactor biosynthesis protein B|nr:molybdenum cofactor biosynthesis protein [Bacillales bacterium]
MSVHEHKSKAPKSVNCMIITVSDTRDFDTDTSGKLMEDLLLGNSHTVTLRRIVKDDRSQIESALNEGLINDNIDIILINGGTGLAKRDVTIETLKPILDKEMVGFGEIFRMLSYTEDIGSAAILSRAIAGVKDGKAIFATPGSKGAVKLAMEKLILPELSHVVWELRRSH